MNRLYKLDNAKAFLIYLVVVGHMLAPHTSEMLAIRNVSLWLFTFHMPAFIFISGLLRKPSEKLRTDKIIGYLVTAYSLQILLYLTKVSVGFHSEFSFIEIASTPWYLITLAAYEVIFYLLRKIDSKYVILGSVILSALMGYTDIGSFMSVSRIVNFMPIYALGFYLEPKTFCEKIDSKKKLGWIVMICLTVACIFAPWKGFNLTAWFAGRKSYYLLSLNDPWGFRLIILAVEIVITLAFLSIVPNKETKISFIGNKSGNIYYWHRSVCYIVNYFASVSLPLYLVISAFITLILSLKIFDHPMNDIMKMAKKIRPRN